MIRSLLVAVLVAAALTPPALASPPAPDVPGDIAVAEGNKPYMTLHAKGVQIYSCNGQAWTLVAPRADLYDGGRHVGTHFAGPTWKLNDGSATVATRVAGVNVDPTAIDWLLLDATPTAEGRLGETTFIQRINTTGGRAPAGPCEAGTRIEVPYTADYVFWKARL
jgi:Protein of unknown function (DUF3455)